MSDKPLYPMTLTRGQFLNALEQYTVWLFDEYLEVKENEEGAPKAWVDHMDSTQPCWPEEEE